MRCCWRLSGLLAAVVCFQVTARASQTPYLGCTFPDADVAWLQRAIAGWEQVSRGALKIEPSPLPWIILFDDACIWHVGDSNPGPNAKPIKTDLMFDGKPLLVRATSRERTVLMPNGVPVSTEMKASTALYRNGRATFVSMAMPPVWQTRDVSEQTRREYLYGVFSHEMTHSRLLQTINRRVHELTRTGGFPYPVTDDVIQDEFQSVAGFRDAFERERDMFYHAVREVDPARRRAKTIRALEMVRARQARYFKGPAEPYAEIESLFLTMEGVGQWAAFQLLKSRGGGNEVEALRTVRDNRKYWSQDEGLALFLLIDALVPDWQSRIFTANPASPFALLEGAVKH